MMPDVNLSQKLIITFPNIRILDLEQIQLNTKSAELLISLINDYNNNLKQVILNKEESNAKHIIQQIQIDKLDFIKNINDNMLKSIVKDINDELKIFSSIFLSSVANQINSLMGENRNKSSNDEQSNDELSKDEHLYSFSQLRGLEFNFTSFGETNKAISACSFISGLRYLKIQLIENSSLMDVFQSIISNLNNIDELILECNSSFMLTYPKNNIIIDNEELIDNKIGLKVCLYCQEYKECFYHVETKYLSISFNYTFVEVTDLENNEIEIDGSDYCSYLHLKGIKPVKEYEELKLDCQLARFNIVLPNKIDKIDIINLKIGDNFIDYLSKRSFPSFIPLINDSIITKPKKKEDKSVFVPPKYRVSIYIHSAELPKSNLDFYIKLLKNNLINELALAIRQVPVIKSNYGSEDIIEFEDDIMLKMQDIIDLFETPTRLEALRISYSFVDFVGKTPSKLTFNLILNFIEHVKFLNEIEFSCGFLPPEDIVRFIKSAKNITPYASRCLTKIHFNATMDQTPTKRRLINEALIYALMNNYWYDLFLFVLYILFNSKQIMCRNKTFIVIDLSCIY